MRVIFEAVLTNTDKEVRLIAPTGEYYTICDTSVAINKFILVAMSKQVEAEQAILNTIANKPIVRKEHN